MFRLPLVVAYLLAAVPQHAQAALQVEAASAASDFEAVIWIVLVLAVIVGGLSYSTWDLLKSERKAREGKKPSE